jgi:hypothetical protein
MGLKFRRGTTAQKSGSLAFGEPYVNTDLGTLQIGGAAGDITLGASGTGSAATFAGISGSSLDITGNAKIDGNLRLGGNITIGDATADTVNVVASLSSSLIPSTTDIFDLGSPTKQWRDLYLSSASLYIDGTQVLSSNATELIFTTDTGQSIKFNELGSDNIVLQTVDGDIELKSSGGGDVLLDPTTGLISVKGNVSMQDGTAKFLSSGGTNIVFGNNLEVTGSIITTGTINGLTLSAGIVSSSAQTIANLPTGVVSGSAQTIANLPTGVVSGSSQLENANITNLTITNLTTVNQTASVVFSSGSNRFGDAGNDTHSFTGSVQVSGSLTTIGTSTATSFNGTINSTNGVISGSSQVTGLSNAQLTNSSITIGSTAISLGSSATTIAGLTSVSSTGFTGALTGNASTATTLQTARAINGVNFDGSAAITVTAAAGTLSGATLASGVTASSLTSVGTLTTLTVSGATATGALTVTGAVTATGDITAFFTSDKRHKNNIQTIPNALEKVSKLNGVTWEWNDDVNEVTKSTPKTGLIAQEVQEVLPEVVKTRDDGFLALDYSKMMGLMVEAIKEQQQQIHNLTLQIEELKSSKGL